MIATSLKYNTRRLKQTELSEYAHRRLVTLWRRCAREYFTAAIREIPIDTGMSMASLMPLAAKVRARALIERELESSAHSPKRGYTDISGNYVSDGWKSIAQGEREGSSTSNFIKFGTPTHPSLEFQFSITVYQHAFHEWKWGSLDRAKEAFLSCWDENVLKYVSAKDLLEALTKGKMKVTDYE